jgi:hypothetical protein
MADFWDGLSGSVQSIGGIPGGDTFAQQLTDLYHQNGRPDPTPQEIEQHRGNPGGLAAVGQMLQSDNATAMANANPPPVASGSMFGSVPAPFVPPSGSTTYAAPQFSEAAPTFAAPTPTDVLADPGYQFGLDQGVQRIQRAAAGRGTILNPGTVQALTRYGTDYATTKTNDVFNRSATTFDKALATYGAKYNVFQGNSAAAAQANQANFNNAQSTYGVNYEAKRTADNDYWSRLNDVANRGAQASAA